MSSKKMTVDQIRDQENEILDFVKRASGPAGEEIALMIKGYIAARELAVLLDVATIIAKMSTRDTIVTVFNQYRKDFTEDMKGLKGDLKEYLDKE